MVDERHLPVLISTFFGQATEQTIREYYAYLDDLEERLVAAGQRYASITDASSAERPDPTVRKLIAELTDAASERGAAASLGGPTIINNVLVRGALTAIQWLSRKKLEVDVVKDFDEAVMKARALVDAAGMRWPTSFDPASYHKPLRPTGSTR